MFSKPAFILVFVMASVATAYTGRASWDSLGTTPCPVSCALTDYRVALPAALFPSGENCCSQVAIQYKGKTISATFTDLFLASANSKNISLSNQAFSELAELEVGTIEPISWDFE